MAKIISFKSYSNAQTGSKKKNALSSTHSKDKMALNDIKIRFIEYFSEQHIGNLFLKPVNLNCGYEGLLITLCKVAKDTKNKDLAMVLAETIYKQDVSGLTLNGFIECISRDDLIMGCLQSEIKRLKQVDRLFLVNVLKSKFPKEETCINLLKTVLFAQDQSHKLETSGPMSQEG